MLFDYELLRNFVENVMFSKQLRKLYGLQVTSIPSVTTDAIKNQGDNEACSYLVTIRIIGIRIK